MNLERVIRITSLYFFLTGYHIRWYDRKSLHYRLPVWEILYFLILLLIYLICFGHHFEKSSMLKMLLDMSPFLNDLVRVHVLLGLKVYIFCMIEWTNLTKIFNTLVNLCKESIKHPGTFDRLEVLIYLMFFSTFIVCLGFGLYIAIELRFELPPLDHILIGMALFIPHFTLAGCLRLYTLGLWLMEREFENILTTLKNLEKDNNSKLETSVVIEIVNPVFNHESSNGNFYGFYEKLSKRMDFIVDFLHLFDKSLQRQLGVLMGLNFNCLLAGAYGRLYFENSWHILFTQRNRRIFYAANSAIFVCIAVDYAMLLIARWGFYRVKYNLYNFIINKIFAKNQLLKKSKKIFKYIKHKLSKEVKLRLCGLIEFNIWNFIMLQALTISIIAIIISYQYLGDEIKALNERYDINESE